MRKLSPDPRSGKIVSQTSTPITSIRARFLDKPSDVLSNIDRLREGAAPRICCTRSQGGIGDVLMTLPAVKAISVKYNTPVTYATDYDYLDGALPAVVQHVPYIDKIISFRDVKTTDYDAVIDFTCPCIAHEQPGARPINRIDLFANHTKVKLADTSIDYLVTKDETGSAINLISDKINIPRNNYKLVIVQPSSSTSRRDLPLAKQKNLISKLANTRSDVRFLVLTHSSDSVLAKDAGWNYLPNTIEIKDLKVRQIAALISLSDLTICQDSAILHLAGALSKPSFSFFGPTDPRARVNYYANAVAAWGAHDLKCQNCWYAPCPANHLCWGRIDESICLQAINAMLDDKPLLTYPELVTFNHTNQTSYEIL